MRFLLILLLLWPAAAMAADAPPEEDVSNNRNTATLQGLNKVTGHISTLAGPVGTEQRFGNLDIVVRRCWKAPPEERPENAALLDISELKPGEPPQRIFLGWMFSSSPGLSGLEHPVYDITVVSCDDVKEQEPAPKEPEKKLEAKKPVEKKAVISPPTPPPAAH
jgi:hypothetical protein